MQLQIFHWWNYVVPQAEAELAPLSFIVVEAAYGANDFEFPFPHSTELKVKVNSPAFPFLFPLQFESSALQSEP